MAGNGRRNADPLLLAALLGGATLADAAKRAGMGEQTARRRLRDPEFRAQLDAAGDEVVEAAVRGLTDATGEAVAGLRDLMRGGPPSVRLGAVRAVLELGPKWRVEYDVETRLRALERALAARQSS